MISLDSIVMGMMPLDFYCSAKGLMTSNVTLGIGTDRLGQSSSGMCLKSHYVGDDFLLLRLESQNSSIYQGLDLVFEDIAPTGRVMHYPMKEAVIWIICKPHLIRSSSFR